MRKASNIPNLAIIQIVHGAESMLKRRNQWPAKHNLLDVVEGVHDAGRIDRWLVDLDLLLNPLFRVPSEVAQILKQTGCPRTREGREEGPGRWL
jgi:hypothetical protein